MAQRQPTIMEESFADFQKRTGGTLESWRFSVNEEWIRIRASLAASGHWHKGQSCHDAKCAERS
jgi:hypothetical protein